MMMEGSLRLESGAGERRLKQRQGPGWLFVPADRTDRHLKAQERSDVVIIDLEDAVCHDRKSEARDWLPSTQLDPRRTVVRINGTNTDYFAADVQALARSPFHRVMLPMAEDVEQVAELSDFEVVALVETARGVRRSGKLAEVDHVVGLMLGAEDLVETLGGQSSRATDGRYADIVRHAWSEVLFNARAEGKFALDSVWTDISNFDGLRVEAQESSAAGYSGKAAIHPSHIAVIRSAFSPPAEAISWARAVVDRASDGDGVFTVEGQLIDAPLLAQARRILRSSGGEDPQ